MRRTVLRLFFRYFSYPNRWPTLLIMTMIPFENYTLITDLSRDDALKRLEKLIEPLQPIRIRALKSKRNKSYEGIIEGNNFKVIRIIGYGNSFVPTIIGQINKESKGSRVEIKMRPKKIVIALFLFLFLLFTIFFIMGWDLICYVVALLFMYLLAIILFKTESRRSKTDLNNIFKIH